MSVFTKLFGTHSEHELKRIKPLVDKMEALRPTMQALSDEQLRAKTDEYKKRLAEGETLDDLLPGGICDSARGGEASDRSGAVPRADHRRHYPAPGTYR